MQTLLEDLQFAFRNFLKTPRVCILIILTLAFGIGVNASMFSMVYNVLLAPLPFSEGHQLVKLKTNHPAINRFDVRVSVPTAFDYINQNQTLSHLVEYHQMPFTLFGYGDAANVEAGVVSWNFFEMLKVKPLLGRTFLPGEDEPGAKPVIILSHHYWREKFGSDPKVVGMFLEMNDAAIQVIGVMQPLPEYPFKNDIWMGSSSCPGRGSDTFINSRTRTISNLYGKLKSGVSLQSANLEINSISKRIAAEYPDTYPLTKGLSNSLIRMKADMTGDSTATFYLLMGITGLVLLIACANVANLNLARTASRKQEFAIREALGANPKRIARQVMTESILLSLAGGLLGLVIAFLSIDILAQFAALYTPLSSEVKINSGVLVFCLVISLLTGILSGATAAFQKRNINEALKEGSGNITANTASKRLRQALLIVQFTLAFIILTSAVMVSLSLSRLYDQEMGFEAANIVAVGLSKSRHDRRQFVSETANKLESRPEIESVAFASLIPLVNGMHERPFFQIEGQPPMHVNERPDALAIAVSANYHQVLNIPLKQGRYFTLADDQNSPGAILINQQFADEFFANVNPIGQRISQDQGKSWQTVRGVVGNVREMEVDVKPEATFYSPYMEGWQYELSLLVNTRVDLESTRLIATEIIHQVNPRQPVATLRTLQLIKEDKLSASNLVSLLLSLFAGLAFLITLSGVIGVVAYNVSQRRKEIGIRVALGANPKRIRSLFAIQGLSLAAIGIVIGVITMAFLSPLLGSVLFKTDPLDFIIYLATALIIFLVAAIAILLPTRQAMLVQPVEALREQ